MEQELQGGPIGCKLNTDDAGFAADCGEAFLII
jgi:hypothetical protein